VFRNLTYLKCQKYYLTLLLWPYY